MKSDLDKNMKDPITLAITEIADCLNDNDGHELNLSNYHHDDVGGLNNAYVNLFQTLESVNEKLRALQSQPAVNGLAKVRAFELLDRIDVQCKAVGHPVGGIDELKSILDQQPAAAHGVVGLDDALDCHIEHLEGEHEGKVVIHKDTFNTLYEAARLYAQSSQAVPDGWQTIETAPKDGAEFLAYRDDAGVFLIRWDAPENFLREDECIKLGESAAEYSWIFADFIQGDRLDGDEIPTHWMPLPAAPKHDLSKGE